MNDNSMPSQYDLGELLLLLLEGEITEEHFKELLKRLNTDSKARDYYYEFLTTYIGFGSYGHSGISLKSADTADEYGAALSRITKEMVAPCARIEKHVEQSSPVPDTRHPNAVQKIYKTLLITAIISIAALIMMVCFINRVGPQQPVATLDEAMNPVWSSGAGSYDQGDTFARSYDSIELKSGIVRLKFNYGAEAIIEGPCVFSCVSPERLQLHSGKVYIRVPSGAEGFTVRTPTCSIVDLGTEFGVDAGGDSNTTLQMVKGKASLTTTVDPNSISSSRIVRAGQACRIDQMGSVNTIEFIENKFVRQFNSKMQFISRGEKITLNLADIIGGGSGFGSGGSNQWIDLMTGRSGTQFITSQGPPITDIGRRPTDNQYHSVSHIRYIDGVFSPDGGMGKVQISSKGHPWKDCPDTSGYYFEDIFNGSFIANSTSHKLILQGQAYGTKERPAIALHSNAGITFDLDAIRTDMPGLDIIRFRAICGISQEAKSWSSINKEDFWVLVDGQKRFEAIGMQVSSAPREISIPLSNNDRFLTLVSTDGDLGSNWDWGLFALPRLEIESIH